MSESTQTQTSETAKVTPFPGTGSNGRAEPDDDLPSSGLLSFYDRLRDRMVAYVGRKGGRLASQVVQALLLVPDVFLLLLRLTLDRDVPRSTRALLGSALAYFLLPIDFLPEIFAGPTGYLDDMVLALLVLSQAFGDDLEPIAEKHWSGPHSVHTVLHDVLGAAQSLLGHDLYQRLQDTLGRHGVDVGNVEGERAGPG